jgi:conjugal transfer pilus assembly protein TraB
MKIKEWLTGKRFAWLAVLIGVLAAGFFFLSGPDQPAQPAGKRTEVNLLGDAEVEKEHWRATAEREVEAIKAQQKEIAEQLKNLTEQIKEKEEKGSERPAGPSSRIPPAPKDFPPIPPFPPLNLTPPPSPPESAPQLQQNLKKPAGPPPQSIRIFLPEAGVSAAEITETKAEGPDRGYLPSGSFIPGVLLSGLDAPAGVSASGEPHPVLIELSDLAVLPNQFRLDVKECRIVGEGYGDISSERAFIRTTTLSCVKTDGSSIDVPLKGFVAGEDGKNGLRGRVVSKEGQIIAKALLAGFADGISKAFSLSATTVSVSPLGMTQTVDPDRALEMGALTGVSRAADRLSQFYLRMAEQIFPIIEVDAGRKVDIGILQGVLLRTTP